MHRKCMQVGCVYHLCIANRDTIHNKGIIQVLQISEAQTTLSGHLASKVLGSLVAKLDQRLFVESSYLGPWDSQRKGVNTN